jgi:hypothetical protein
MGHHRVLFLILAFSLIFSIGAIASEKFVLSAVDGRDVLLQTYKLDQDQIKVEHSARIRATDDGSINTAVTFRKDNSELIFDVYYSVCTYDIARDLDCATITLSMSRLDSSLDLLFQKDFTIPARFNFTAEKIQKQSGLSSRLLLRDVSVVEYNLHKNGRPGIMKTVVFDGPFAIRTAAEDGRMVAALSGKQIQVRTFHPTGPVKLIRIQDYPLGLTITGPVAVASSSLAGSIELLNRFLFFRVWRSFRTMDRRIKLSRIMMQRVSNSTGESIGPSKAITKFAELREDFFQDVFQRGQTVAVTQRANIVFYTELDRSCNKNILKAQVFNPETSTKVGTSQLIIGCSQVSSKGISGIDVTQFQP